MRVPAVSPRGAAVLCAFVAAGCHSLQPVPLRYIAETRPAVVYVADGFGVVTTITNPRLSGDTVVGTVPGANTPVALPLHEVQRVSTVRLNRGRTALLVGGIAAAGAFMAYAVLSNAGGRSDFTCDYNNPSYLGPQCGFPNP